MIIARHGTSIFSLSDIDSASNFDSIDPIEAIASIVIRGDPTAGLWSNLDEQITLLVESSLTCAFTSSVLHDHRRCLPDAVFLIIDFSKGTAPLSEVLLLAKIRIQLDESSRRRTAIIIPSMKPLSPC